MADIDRAVFAAQPLFAPLARVLGAFDTLPASTSQLNAHVDRMRRAPVSGSGAPIRFVAPGGADCCYEQRVFGDGEVETRADNWHDFFNALVWLTFPLTKAALNTRHHEALVTRSPGRRAQRGPVRDAATQFDECGVVVISAEGSLFDLLQAHRWRDLFWRRRADVLRLMRFFVIGHALFDQLRAPFVGLCGKALLLDVPRGWLAESLSFQVPAVDDTVARLLVGTPACSTPREFQPLPVLGIPGVVPGNAQAEYYEDLRQFHPRRPGMERASSTRVEVRQAVNGRMNMEVRQAVAARPAHAEESPGPPEQDAG